jgi:methionyl-tRNA formyltransferase
MITTSKIAVLCNNRMAIPALQSLLASGQLCAMGVPENNTDVIDFCTMISKQSGIPLLIMNKEKFHIQIDEMLIKNNPKYIFTMTFPWKISAEIIKKHPSTFYNFHYGLLPEMRGADPVFECLRSNAAETGITVHTMEYKIDTGAIILKKTLPINSNMTHGILCTHLSWLGANILNELLTLLNKGFQGTKQDHIQSKYYSKPDAADVCISWQKSDAQSIEALSRACNPWNKGAYTQWNGWNIRVVESTVIEKGNNHSEFPGTIVSLNQENGLIIQCHNGTQLRLDIIYTDEGFMSGHKLSAFGIKKGSQFTNL